MNTAKFVLDLSRNEEKDQEKKNKEKEMWDNYRKNLVAKKDGEPEEKR